MAAEHRPNSPADLGYGATREPDPILQQLRAAGADRVGILSMCSREDQVRLLRELANVATTYVELDQVSNDVETLFPTADPDSRFVRIEFRGVLGRAGARMAGR
jgi:hypothetical protein